MFHEGRAKILSLLGQVVERDSAELGLKNEQCIPVAANHREMVHFKHVDSQKFDPVKIALKEIREGKPLDPTEVRNGTCLMVPAGET